MMANKMNQNDIDNDVFIIGEELPPSKSHFLISKYRVKSEPRLNETVDLTNVSSPVVVVDSSSRDATVQIQSVPRVSSTIRPKVTIIQQNSSNLPIQRSISCDTAGSHSIMVNGTVNPPIVVSVPPASAANQTGARLTTNISAEMDQPDGSDLTMPTINELLSMIASRKGSSNITSIKDVENVNMHELLRSTPAESFSRKGFYSCAGCSSKFTSSDMYNIHVRRQVGDFSFNCDQCVKVIKAPNLCQIVIHMLSVHKTANIGNEKVSFKSHLSLNESAQENGEDFTETARSGVKQVIESFLSDWNVELFNPYQKASKDQRYFLMPMARKDVVQSHKFYSDHYRAANHKLKDQPVELLHCFMCDFVCENHTDLINHLQGDWPNSVTKCAFCTLSIPINKESLCAAKAHVLLHMGIFMMCPRCGFVPPPDLNPEEFEIALRLHLRFVCFHFNLIQIFICPLCGDSNSKAFNTANQVTMHIFDEHLTENRICGLCSSTNNDGSLSFIEFKTHIVAFHNRNDFDSLWADSAISGKKCMICSEVISQREAYFPHMSNCHKPQMVKGKSAFRCFGVCKRIHQSIDEFQSHRSECSECINVKNKLYQPYLTTSVPESTSLCFCMYCGIGVRRKRLENGEIETQSEPQMFANLDLTHMHEQDHILCETNVTACPWCPNRMSAKINEMTRHMETHLPENWFLSWYTKRAERYNNSQNDILQCYCYSAIDNPLSLHCHAIPQVQPSTMPSPSATKHLAITDTIHREFLCSPRHRVSGMCPMCTETELIPNTIEMTWHIFYKHRNNLCYVCKNFKMLNSDNSPKSRVTMWNHVYSCLRLHTPRFNFKTGLQLLETIATCETVMKNCTTFDLKKSEEININPSLDSIVPVEQPLSSDETEMAKSQCSDLKFECGYCKDSASNSNLFASRNLLLDHMKNSHGITQDSDSFADFLCYVCGVKFDSRDKWEDHTLAEHSKGFRKLGLSLINRPSVVLDTVCTTYRCYLCNHRFEKKSTCETHMRNKHSLDQGDINWGMLADTTAVPDTSKRAKHSLNSSKLCLSTYPSKRLKVETNGDTSDGFVCGLCPYECHSRKDMINHAVTFHMQSPNKKLDYGGQFVCPDCSLTFISAKSRVVHMKLIHKIIDPTKFLDTIK